MRLRPASVIPMIRLRTLLFAAPLLGVFACQSHTPAAPADTPAEPASQREPEPIVVTLAAPIAGSVLRIEATGTTEPIRAADVAPPFPGRVNELLVDEGDVVADRQPLARLDATTATLQESQARSNIAALRVQVDAVETEIARFAPLAERGIVPDSQVDQLQAQRDGLTEQLEAAEALVGMAQAGQRDAVLRAPFAGLVTRVDVELGEIASPGGPALRIVDLSSIEVRVRVREAEMGRIRVGDPAAVRIPAQQVAVDGTVAFIDPELDPATRSGTVVVRVPNADGSLLAGTFAEVTITPAAQPAGVGIPGAAVHVDADGAYAFVLDQGALRRRGLVGERLAGSVWLVTSGIDADDRVVVDASRAPRDGAAAVEAGTEPTTIAVEGSGESAR